MKITKKDWDGFWATLNNGGELEWYYDDSDIPDGIDEPGVEPGETFSLTTGVIIYQGSPEAKPAAVPGIFTLSQVRDAIHSRGVTYSLTAAIKRWLASQTTATITAQVPKEHLEAAKAGIESLGGKVL